MGIYQWDNFFIMVGDGAAALAGLVFIAMVLSFAFFISGAWILIIGIYENQVK